MSNFKTIAKMNQMIAEELGETYVSNVNRRVDKDVVLQKYRDAMNGNKVVGVTFSSCDTDGEFTTTDNGVVIILPSDKFKLYATSSHTYATANLLDVEMQVKVYEIDEKDGKVYVELGGNTKTAYTANIREEINKELENSLSKNTKPLVWGKIRRITKDKILVDILDKGILGILNRRYWQKEYIHSLESVCKEGEYYQFEVTGKAPKVEGKGSAWLLSRKNITKGAWESVDLNGLEKNGVILVKCVEKPAGKSYWWGRSDRLPGIELMGDFTARYKAERGIYVGITYKCKIKYIEDRKISVIPFDVIPSDATKVENLRNALIGNKIN